MRTSEFAGGTRCHLVSEFGDDISDSNSVTFICCDVKLKDRG